MVVRVTDRIGGIGFPKISHTGRSSLSRQFWYDKWYDNSAIYTGSTTIVNGKPVMMYPGKCNDEGTSVDPNVCNAGKG